jgi:hypothetical protein
MLSRAPTAPTTPRVVPPPGAVAGAQPPRPIRVRWPLHHPRARPCLRQISAREPRRRRSGARPRAPPTTSPGSPAALTATRPSGSACSASPRSRLRAVTMQLRPSSARAAYLRSYISSQNNIDQIITPTSGQTARIRRSQFFSSDPLRIGPIALSARIARSSHRRVHYAYRTCTCRGHRTRQLPRKHDPNPLPVLRTQGVASCSSAALGTWAGIRRCASHRTGVGARLAQGADWCECEI